MPKLKLLLPFNLYTTDLIFLMLIFRCKIKRDNIYLKKWNKPDTYTGLRQRPELTLG